MHLKIDIGYQLSGGGAYAKLVSRFLNDDYPSVQEYLLELIEF